MELNNNPIKWYKTPIEREKLKKLTQKSDLKAFKQVAIQIVVTALLGYIVYYLFINKNYIFAFFVYYVYAAIYDFMGASGAGHELSHRSVFKTKWLNEFFMILFSITSYFEFSWFRASHKHHHQFTLHRDSDREVVLPIPLKRKTYLIWGFFDFNKFYVVFKTLFKHATNRFDTDWEKHIFSGRDEKYRNQAKWWARFLFVFHLSVLIVSIIT